MKFSDFDEKRWQEVGSYYDTCLLPVTGLSGGEPPWMATAALEQLRDLLDAVEIPFKGRIVTYPALHYLPTDAAPEHLEAVASRLKRAGFRYVIAALREPLSNWQAGGDSSVDEALCLRELEDIPPDKRKSELQARITAVWNKRDS